MEICINSNRMLCKAGQLLVLAHGGLPHDIDAELWKLHKLYATSNHTAETYPGNELDYGKCWLQFLITSENLEIF